MNLEASAFATEAIASSIALHDFAASLKDIQTCSSYSGPSSSFTVSGKYNGSNVNSTVSFKLYGSLKLTDVYDGFKMSVADFVDGAIMVSGFSGKFAYNRGDENAYAFGCAIEATEKNVTD